MFPERLDVEELSSTVRTAYEHPPPPFARTPLLRMFTRISVLIQLDRIVEWKVTVDTADHHYSLPHLRPEPSTLAPSVRPCSIVVSSQRATLALSRSWDYGTPLLLLPGKYRHLPDDGCTDLPRQMIDDRP